MMKRQYYDELSVIQGDIWSASVGLGWSKGHSGQFEGYLRFVLGGSGIMFVLY